MEYYDFKYNNGCVYMIRPKSIDSVDTYSKAANSYYFKFKDNMCSPIFMDNVDKKDLNMLKMFVILTRLNLIE